MSEQTVIKTAEALHRFAMQVFDATGMSEDHARMVADVLIWANLRGVDSHGVLRIPQYINAMDRGVINPGATVKFTKEKGATATIDGDRGIGAIGMTMAAERSIALAKDHGIGMSLVKGCTHTGPNGYYALMAADAHMVGLALTSSRPHMAYHGAAGFALGTNPIAFAAPSSKRPHIVFDMGTSAISLGKIAQARQTGKALPEGVALNADGKTTTDPNDVAMPLSMAGAKGSGLALLNEAFASLLSAVPLLSSIPDAERGNDFLQNGVVIAIDPDAFEGRKAYEELADALYDKIKALPPAEGFDEVLVPGERSGRILKEREKNGIPVPPGTWKGLTEVAERYGIELSRDQ